MAIPIGYDIISKEIRFCDVQERREKRASCVTKNDLFRSQVKQAIKNGTSFDYKLADNCFGSKENVKMIYYEAEKKFINGIKKNRLLALSEEARKKGQYQNLKTLHLEDNEKRKVWLKELTFPGEIIKKIFKNEDGSREELYFVTNDLESEGDRIY